MVSTLSGPIPFHPYYDKTDPKQFLDLPPGRTRPEAAEYASHGVRGTVGMLFEITGRACSAGGTSGTRKKPDPKDHVAENVRRMRRIQRENKKKQAESPQPVPVKALWKSSKYDGVASKVRDELKKEGAGPSRPSSAGYLRAHSRTGWTPVPRSRPSSTEPHEEKLNVPTANSAREVKLVRHDIDFVRANGIAAKHSGVRRSPSLTMLDDLQKKREDDIKSYQRGHVPQYLVTRQKQWAKDEEERRRNIPDPDLPPGHRVMSKAEQQDTLKKLKDSQAELVRQISCLPIRTDTLTIRNRKHEMDRKLAEVEEAIKIFSRPKVFIKMDS